MLSLPFVCRESDSDRDVEEEEEEEEEEDGVADNLFPDVTLIQFSDDGKFWIIKIFFDY